MGGKASAAPLEGSVCGENCSCTGVRPGGRRAPDVPLLRCSRGAAGAGMGTAQRFGVLDLPRCCTPVTLSRRDRPCLEHRGCGSPRVGRQRLTGHKEQQTRVNSEAAFGSSCRTCCHYQGLCLSPSCPNWGSPLSAPLPVLGLWWA